MTCDVEDYFQVSAFADQVNRDEWSSRECRIPRNVDLILERFADANVKATFFTLGWVAENHPDVVRRIAEEGHEVASHGMEHKRVWQQSRVEFLADASSSKKLLEDVSGHPVSGYRAASWSIDDRTPWAHDALEEAGYRYSSSVYPIRHDHFGMPNAPSQPHFPDGTEILEVPASVVRIMGRNIPAGGGGYFRLYPLPLSTWFINRLQQAGGAPVVFYFHPWEMDAHQPRVEGISLRARFKHYVNLATFPGKLDVLLSKYRWDRMDNLFLRLQEQGGDH